jgi:hypothetical protein
MRHLVLLVLTWVLAVALPVQGVAATVAACGSRHGGHASAHAPSPGADSAAHPAHRHHATTARGNDALAQPVHVTTKVANDAGHKCSACASCCLNAVVPTGAISFDTIALGDDFAPLVTAPPAASVTQRLERPPRTFLA